MKKHLKSKDCSNRAENCWEMVSSVTKQMDAPGLITRTIVMIITKMIMMAK